MGMKGLSDKQAREQMDKSFEAIKKTLPEAELIDSVLTNETALEGDELALEMLGKSIILMAGADMVFFINDYKNYRGCNAEKALADAYGKMCVEFKTT